MANTLKRLIIAAAFAAGLLLPTSNLRAGDTKAVPPANKFVVLLEGTFQPAGLVADFGLELPNLNNGRYQKVPFYHVESGVPGPNDPVAGTFYALGGEGFFCFPLRMLRREGFHTVCDKQ